LAERDIGGKVRLACSSESCEFVYWNNPTPVVAAIVEKGGDVILVRSKGWPEKWFGIVTSHLNSSSNLDKNPYKQPPSQAAIFLPGLDLVSCQISLLNKYVS